MADIFTYIELFLDSLAILSLFLTLYMLSKIIKAVSKLGDKSNDNKDIIDFMQKTSDETLMGIHESLDIFLEHMNKVDKLLSDQAAYSASCDTMIYKQEAIIRRQEMMINSQDKMLENQSKIIDGQKAILDRIENK